MFVSANQSELQPWYILGFNHGSKCSVCHPSPKDVMEFVKQRRRSRGCLTNSITSLGLGQTEYEDNMIKFDYNILKAYNYHKDILAFFSQDKTKCLRGCSNYSTPPYAVFTCRIHMKYWNNITFTLTRQQQSLFHHNILHDIFHFVSIMIDLRRNMYPAKFPLRFKKLRLKFWEESITHDVIKGDCVMS